MTTLAAPISNEAQAATTTQAPPVAAATQAAAPTTGTLLGEQKDTKPTEPAKAGEAKAPVAGAPEKYEFKPPTEGHTFDSEVLKAYSEVARELNLTQESAQKVIDKLAPVMQTRQQNAIEAARTEWREAAKADKEFGGDKLTESLKVAKTALDKFGTPELRKLLDESGAGDHAELIRFMVRVGKAISPDTIVTEGGSANANSAQRVGGPDFNDLEVQKRVFYGAKG